MSSSRDDFGIAFRSALLQRGAAQKFSLVFLIIIASVIFFLDVYGFGFMKPVRSLINDGIYRVTLVASSPSKFIPKAKGSVTNLFNIKNENERLKQELEIYKQKELNVEYLTNQNKNLKKIISYLENNKIISIISDAGTPTISDPGGILINECIKNKINIFPVPGSSAATAAVSISGFSNNFIFCGFLPSMSDINPGKKII